MTFSVFLDDLASNGASFNTLEAYRRDVEQFSDWFRHTNGGDIAPELVTGIDLREYHTCATNLLKTGVDTRVVAAILGHENINTTAIYAVPGVSDMTKALEGAEP